MTRKTSAYARKRAHISPAQAEYDRLTAVYRVMGRVQHFTPTERDKLALPVHAAFDGLMNGTASEPDFHTVAAVVNVCLLHAEQIGPSVVEQIQAAQAGLMRCWERHKATAKWGLDGPARQDIAAAVDMHDQLLELCTPLQLSTAMKQVLERMSKGNLLAVDEIQ